MFESNESVADAFSSSDNNQIEKVSAYLEVEKVSPHLFGNFGGALSWPVPLTVAQKQEALDAACRYLDSLDNSSTPGLGILDLLNYDKPLSNEALLDPPSALETLITSPRGQALGEAVENRLNGIATDVSVNEYAMAGIQLVLNQGPLDRPSFNMVAGFDLVNHKHWGKPASAVFRKLSDYLIKTSASSRGLAGLTASLVLAWKAPEFLIEDLPDNLKYGSTAWFNLTVAARTIEAHTPGKVPYMTFAQVMASAESAALIDPEVTGQVHAIALADWGVVNGVIERQYEERYTSTQLEKVKTQFNQQLTDRLNALILLNSQIPSRKDIALARLKSKFKGDIPFEERLLEQEVAIDPSDFSVSLNPTLNGRYSLLDIAMMGGPPYYRWTTRDPRLRPLLGEINAPLELGVRDTFQARFDSAVSNLKEGARLTVKHLISELPLEDRKNLEYGNVSFYQHKTYRLSMGFFGKNLISTRNTLTVKVDTTLYEIDLKRGVIDSKPYDPAAPIQRVDPFVPSIQYTIEPFYLADKAKAAELSSQPQNSSLLLASYSSERTQLIAEAFVQHLDLDNEDILKAAKGLTTQDREDAVMQKVIDFVVDLIPFKSAITNFIKGNYVDGAMDLFLDVLGFVTAGASVTAKLAKIGATTASAISKTLKAAKIIGAVVITELNPVNALRDLGLLLGSGLKFLGTRGLQQIIKLRGVADSNGLLQALSIEHGPTLIGTWKIGEQSIDGVGVLKNEQWYHYNPVNNRLYGAPGDFRPKPGRFVLGGLDNKDLSAFAVKPSDIAGLEANAHGIFRSADGERFYIRNIDATGKEAVYWIRNDFTLSGGLTDVIIVNPATNRVHGTRLWQVAPDQWQPLSTRGGNVTDGVDGLHSGEFRGEIPAPETPAIAIWIRSPVTRERLPNGLSEPVIEVVGRKDVLHLSRYWGKFQDVPYTASPTDIHQALSDSEFGKLAINSDLFNPRHWSSFPNVDPQLVNKEGGGTMIFSMLRMKTSGAVKTEFNALKVVELKAGELPGQLDSVHGYWVPQGGYADIPAHPGWADADHVFTPSFSGCSFTVDQMAENSLRVRHVESGKEAAQYIDLPAHEHGWGQSAAMEFPDYGVRYDQNGNADTVLTGFSYMKYDRTARQWTMHYQAQYGAPVIHSFSRNDPGWFDDPTRIVRAYPEAHIVKTGAKPVKVVARTAQRSDTPAAVPA